jgi:hypothetical protein
LFISCRLVAPVNAHGGVQHGNDLAVVDRLVDAAHAAAGTATADLEAAGIEVHLTHDTLEVSMPFEPPAVGGVQAAAKNLSALLGEGFGWSQVFIGMGAAQKQLIDRFVPRRWR